MWIKFLLITVCVSEIYGHLGNTALIRKLRKDVRNLQDTQDSIIQTLNDLESNLTAKITGAVPSTGKQSTGKATVSADFLDRLNDLEGRVAAVKNYLMGEKKGDIQLRKTSEHVIKEMRDKVKETNVVIGELRTNVSNSLRSFEDKIVSVNKTAFIKVNANGAVMYGGIGSTCSTNGGECTTKDSECRDSKCQCVPGLSYDLQERKCVASCSSYGNTYQTVARRIIRGFNDKTVEDVSLPECTQHCSDEKSFVCRSFDYFPQWESCFLSASVMTDADDDAWEYNMEGYHFQRDCQ